MAKTCLKMALLLLIASHCIVLSMALCESKEDCVIFKCEVGTHAICSNGQCTCVADQVNEFYCQSDDECKPHCKPHCKFVNCIEGTCSCGCIKA
ncbi:putative defensin-like protein 263 [Mercurialis annua]|uniref:putative defensin-like protein 263 n=1 Tax=Mercurialis annua TaxID=3986 RepID=UPI00215F6C3F|nr:putative defensin-like protein 263 [Mercurialis annua]